MYESMERTVFTDEELKVQDSLKETIEGEEMGNNSASEVPLELNLDAKELSSHELRELASNEFAMHGETPLRDAYLKLAKEKENQATHSEISFGTGLYRGKTAEQWLAEEKIAKIEHKPYNANAARENAKKAAENGL